MPKIKYNNIEFDSQEELDFYHWCNEAVEYKLMDSFLYHVRSWTLSEKQTYADFVQLKTKIVEKEKHLLRPHVFTPDYELFGGKKELGLIEANDLGHYIIDTKGTFNMYGGDREFSINQKWLYDKHGVYVQKIVPEKLFKKTWVPEKVRYTPKTGNLRKKYLKCKTIKGYMEGLCK